MVMVCGVFEGGIILSGCAMGVDSCHAIRDVANMMVCPDVGLLGDELDGPCDKGRVGAEE